MAAAGVDSITWEDIQARSASHAANYELRTNAVPSSSAGPSLPTSASASTSKRVLLYRDTNAWCPFCERVWLALEEKGIEYDTMFIDLRDKPDWFKQMVPTALVPAAQIDGELVWESLDILLKLEEAFPTPALLPSPGTERERILALSKDLEDLGAAGFRFLRGAPFGEEPDEEKVPVMRKEFDAKLAELEVTLAGSPGPYLASSFSLADICAVPSLERLASNLPRARDFNLHGNPVYPRLAAWFAAMDSRDAYHVVKSDDTTHNNVIRSIFGMKFDGSTDATATSAEEATSGREEAAAKLSRNHVRVVADILQNAGIEATESNQTAVDTCMLRLGAQLWAMPLPPISPPPAFKRDMSQEEKDEQEKEKRAAARMKATHAAALAFVRNRVSAPRDMSASAATQFRKAADQLLSSVF